MIQKLKTAGPVKWNKILDQVLPEISTNMTTPDIMKLGLNIFRYKIGETKGFPFDITTSENVIGLEGSYAVAIGHADNVRPVSYTHLDICFFQLGKEWLFFGVEDILLFF